MSTIAQAPDSSIVDLTILRCLVAIASYGTGNLRYLKKIVTTYQRMPTDVRIAVFSEGPKDLETNVEVIVGLPKRNPHSLPFAHKRTFVENVDRYDLFIYTEDDIDVREQHIESFLRITAALEPDEIAGFIRYEIGQDGARYLPDVHGDFHWRLGSVGRREGYTIAEFTNEHAGFYILTQAQLRRAITSGGFLREPYKGRYGMLETGATDPYTSCGFRKVICISALEDFLVHHLPDRYAGRVGLSLEDFKIQIRTLIDVEAERHPKNVLCEFETKFENRRWSKDFYKEPDPELLEMIPADAETILSVGCGWGLLEAKLIERGAKVTALPLDSVIGAMAARLGIEMVYGTLHEGLDNLEGREFDCVLITDLLHLRQDSRDVLGKCAERVRPSGTLVIQSFNFNYLPVWMRATLGLGEMRKLRCFEEGGVNPMGMASIARVLKGLGFEVSGKRWFNHPHFSAPPPSYYGIRKFLGRLMTTDWVLQSRRSRKCGEAAVEDARGFGVSSGRSTRQGPASSLSAFTNGSGVS